MTSSWFMAKKAEPTIRATDTVRLRCPGATTTRTPSRHVDHVAARPFIRNLQDQGFDERTIRGPAIPPYSYGTSCAFLDPELRRPLDELGLGLDTELAADARQVGRDR